MPEHLAIVFDGPPGPLAGRFVEIEDGSGASISLGTWVERENGYWAINVDLSGKE